MENDTGKDQEAKVYRRSRWLSSLLIISAAASCMSLLVVMASAAGGSFSQFFLKIPVLDTMLIEDSAGNWVYVLVKILIIAGSMSGLFYMWKMKKRGFWIYLACEALFLLIPFMFLLNLKSGYLIVRLIIKAIFAVFFILLYWTQLKKMK